MRIYKNCYEAASEMKREVAEMGKIVKLDTYQDKKITGDPDYYTRELLCYSYMIHEPKDKEELLKAFNKNEKDLVWAKQEFADRISGKEFNPGNAWKSREEIWEKFIEKDGKFSYSYPERIGPQVEKVILMLQKNQHARNGIISVWDRELDQDRIGGKRRVPCTMFYQILIRNERVHMIYNIRSNDIMTHWCFDVWLAISLQEYIAKRLGLPVGDFYQFIGSAHAYAKDLKGIF